MGLTRLGPLLRGAAADRASPAALVFAVCVPFIFLHPHYEPSLAFGPVAVDLTDLAIAASVIAAVVAGLRHGFGPLAGGRAVWILLGSFLALILVSLSWARYGDPSYSLTGNLISALKFVEYACLAPAVPLALRRPADRRALYWAIVLWSLALTAIAALQFLGVLNQFSGNRPNEREPSIIGIHDLAAFSGAALSFAFVAIVLPPRRAWSLTAGVAGALGVALAAALDAVGGMVVAAAAIWAFARRRAPVSLARTASLIVLCAVVALAAVTLRSSSIAAFLRFIGLESENPNTAHNIQSYAHRTLLGYIGLEIWIHHPVAGVGWQESKRPHSFDPYLAGARKRFGKSEPPEAFPSPQNMWGVQNGVIQTLSDLGVIGLALLLATMVAAFRLIIRVVQRGPPAVAHEALVVCGWLLVGFAVFTGTGLLPGLAVDAQLWIGVGLAVALHDSLTRAG